MKKSNVYFYIIMGIIAPMNNISKQPLRASSKSMTKYWWTLAAGAILITLGIIFLTVGKKGTITMQIPLMQTTIYIDQKDKRVTTKENESVEVKLSPSTHNIIVSRNGYYPWTKNVSVPRGKTVPLFPIFVPLNSSGQIITTNDPEYVKIKNSITGDKTPTKSAPLVSQDKTVSIWLEGGEIMAKVAATETEAEKTFSVVAPQSPIRNVDFYKDRSDSVIFSTEKAVYVIEVEAEGTQNFMPLFMGEAPAFKKVDANSMYVADGATLMQVII